MNGVYLLLGGNLGDRRKNLNRAIILLGEFYHIESKSKLYESEAWGIEEQPSFYNQVLKGTTLLSPQQLLKSILQVELEIGRERKSKWTERIIDIDILYYHELSIDTEELKIPHPYISVRRFTLLPLAEMAPGGLHPISKKTQAQLLNLCSDPLNVFTID